MRRPIRRPGPTAAPILLLLTACIWGAAVLGGGCHDSNRNYISFDAQPVTDTRSDAPTGDAKSDGDAVGADTSSPDIAVDAVPPVDGGVDAADTDADTDGVATDDAETGP